MTNEATPSRNDVSPAGRRAPIDWTSVAFKLDAHGFANLPGLLRPEECRTLAALYTRDDAFRSRVIMQRHGFGQGEYRYLRYPLPLRVQQLRETLYPPLAEVANRWRERLGQKCPFPAALADFLSHCHAAGQTRPTPLILSYGPGDYNCLHQDLYGEWVFPLQLTVMLSAPGRDFDGGEFLLVEQRPRRQSRAQVVPLRQGEAVVFAVNRRPVRGARGFYQTTLRHGVSTVNSGRRLTLGIIFHDAA